ncbi:hypothetical protein AGMMS50229_21230 [Campylobacterota bacterium]|nr:hypothetical protein AGMMS50229_21230 [Campylobacterota bacterium]
MGTDMLKVDAQPSPNTQNIVALYPQFDRNTGDTAKVNVAANKDFSRELASFSKYSEAIKVSKNGDSYKINYHKEGTFVWFLVGCEFRSSDVSYQLDTRQQGDGLTFYFPSQYAYRYGTSFCGVLVIGPYWKAAPYASFSELEADVKNIFSKISTFKVEKPIAPETRSVQTVSQTLQNRFPKTDPITKQPISLSISGINLASEINSRSEATRVFTRSNGYRLLYNNAAFDITQSVQGVNLLFTLNSTYNFEPSSSNSASLEADAKSTVSKLGTIVLSRSFSKEHSATIEGEVDSKHTDSEVFGNFKRILGGWGSDYQSDAKKANIFTLNVGDRKLPITVEVYPYRGGSKVVYSVPEITIDYKYTLYSDGRVDGSYEERIAQEKKLDADIKTAVALIKKIIES